MFLLLSRFLFGGPFICLHKEQNEVSKITKGGRSEGAAYLICRGLQAARLASSDLLWSWKLEVLATQLRFEVYRKLSRKLLKRHLAVVLGLKLHVTGARSREPRGLFLPQQLLRRESKRLSPRGQGWHNQISGPAQ